MFRISEFSRFTRVSVKALRHYDRLGLLEPAFVDPETGYRYYAARQVAQLQRVLALKDLGFSLEHVRDLIGGRAADRALTRVLEVRRAELESQLDLDRRRLDGVNARLREIEGGEWEGGPEVVLSELPAVRVAARRARVASLDDGVEELFEALERDVAAAGVRSSGPPVVIYHDRDHRQSDASVEVAVPVLPDARQAGRSRIRMLPSVPQAACVAYAGSYEQWTRVTGGLLRWLEARRLAPAGPTREVFLQFAVRARDALRVPPAYLVDRPEDYLSELQVPVRRVAQPRPKTPRVAHSRAHAPRVARTRLGRSRLAQTGALA